VLVYLPRMAIEFSLISGVALGVQYAHEDHIWIIDLFFVCILIELDE
jgi:hypothetical protein